MKASLMRASRLVTVSFLLVSWIAVPLVVAMSRDRNGNSLAMRNNPALYCRSGSVPSDVISSRFNKPETRSAIGLDKLPVRFEANQSQAESGVDFVARTRDGFVKLASTSATFCLGSAGTSEVQWQFRRSDDSRGVLRMKLLGARVSAWRWIG